MNFNFDTGTISLLQYLDCSSLPPLGGTAGVLTIIGTGGFIFPVGTTAQRPTPDGTLNAPFAGTQRWNSTSGSMEYFDGTHWQTYSNSSGAVSSFNTSLVGLTPQTASTGAVTLAGTLGVASGGTGDTTLTLNGVLFGNGTSPVGVTAAGTQYQVLQAGVSGVPTFGAVNLASSSAVTNLLPITNGGTGTNLASSPGSILYNNGTSITNGPVGTAGQLLVSNGASAPSWITASSTLTTNQILEGNGSGAFTANGATFIGSATYSGVTLDGTPTNATDAVTKGYVDAAITGLSWKQVVEARTTADLGGVTYSNGSSGVGATLTANANGALALDGFSPTAGQRVLIANETNQAYNGIYTVTASGSASTPFVLTRATDTNTGAQLEGAAVFVDNGVLYGDTSFVQTTPLPITVGTSNIVWTQFSGAGTYTAGAGLTLTGVQFHANVDNVTTYVNGGNAIAVLSSSTASQVLLSQGAGNTAAWSALPLGNTSAVTGTLGVTNGGTGSTATPANGQLLIGNGTTYSTASLTAGTGISVTTGAGTLTVANTGVTSVAGTANQIFVNGAITAATGAVTLSLPSTLSVANINITSLTPGGAVYVGSGGSVLSTPALTNGQILVGSTGNSPVATTITAGSGITVTNAAGSITVANSGVTGVSLNDASSVPIFTTSPTSLSVGNVAETIALKTQAANLVFAGPSSGAATQPTFRALTASDMPANAGLKLYAEDPSTPTTPIASASNSVAIGNGSVAAGPNSIALGGGTATQNNTFAVGTGSNAFVYGGSVFANGSFATAGDAQGGRYVLRNITTDGTANVELFLDGTTGTQRIVFPNNSVVTFDVLVTARRTDATGGGAGYRFVGVIYKDATAGTNQFIGTPSKTVIGETNVPWDANIFASTINGNLEVAVTGEAGKTIRWVAVVRTTEVTN